MFYFNTFLKGLKKMRKIVVKSSVIFTTLAMSTLALAEGAETGVTTGSGLVAIGSALAIGLAAFGATAGQGRAASSALEGLARNPGARDVVFTPMLLSLVFMEFQALLGFIIAILWLNK